MTKVSRIVAMVVFAVVAAVTFAACAPQARMDAYVKLAHQNAWTIDRVNHGSDDEIQTYILCDAGSVRVVMASRKGGSADILKDVELDKNHVSCQ